MPCPSAPRDLGLDAELQSRIRQGIPRRYAMTPPELEARTELEMDLIRRKRFAGYFLAGHDIIREAKATRTCGRGSDAASIVSYLLGITNLDPIATNLMFERFLSNARMDPPDLDIDFAWDERDGIIASVFRRYGTERVAMVAVHTYSILQMRSASERDHVTVTPNVLIADMNRKTVLIKDDRADMEQRCTNGNAKEARRLCVGPDHLDGGSRALGHGCHRIGGDYAVLRLQELEE